MAWKRLRLGDRRLTLVLTIVVGHICSTGFLGAFQQLGHILRLPALHSPQRPYRSVKSAEGDDYGRRIKIATAQAERRRLRGNQIATLEGDRRLGVLKRK